MKLCQILENHLQETARQDYRKFVRDIIARHYVTLENVMKSIHQDIDMEFDEAAYKEMVELVEDWIPDRLEMYDLDQIYTGEGIRWAKGMLNDGNYEELFQTNDESWKSYTEIYNDPETREDFKHAQKLDRRKSMGLGRREGVNEYDDGDPTRGDMDADAYQGRLKAALKNAIGEDFTTVFNVFDDIDISDERLDKIEAAVPDRLKDVEDFENLYIYNNDVEKFRSLVLQNPHKAFNLVQSEEEIGESDYADDIADGLRDSDERDRDVYGYHGVSRRDFM